MNVIVGQGNGGFVEEIKRYSPLLSYSEIYYLTRRIIIMFDDPDKYYLYNII